jgi:hypothetical protein
MAEDEGARRSAVGVVWHEMTVGSSVGRPLAEWAYISPRFPNGITASSLQLADADTQREVAAFWFLANLKPYDLSGGPWFGFGPESAGYDHGYLAPKPVHSPEVLNKEFGDTLQSELRQEIARRFDGQWMWLPPLAIPPDPMSLEQTQVAILSRLEGLEAAIRGLSPPVGIGHNQGPLDPPLSDQERSDALLTIEEARVAVKAGDRSGATILWDKWTALAPKLQKLAAWTLKLVGHFAMSFVGELGKVAARPSTYVVIYAIKAWHEHRAIGEMLEPYLAHFAR